MIEVSESLPALETEVPERLAADAVGHDQDRCARLFARRRVAQMPVPSLRPVEPAQQERSTR